MMAITFEFTGKMSSDAVKAAEVAADIMDFCGGTKFTRSIAIATADRLGGDWDADAVESLLENCCFSELTNDSESVEIQFLGYKPVMYRFPLNESPFEQAELHEANEFISNALMGDSDDDGWFLSDANGEVFQVRKLVAE